MPYTSAQIIAQLTSVSRTWSFRYQVLDLSNSLTGVANVESASLDYSYLADVKGTAKFTIKKTDAINYQSNRLQPVACLLMPDGGYQEWPMGVYILASPTKIYQDASKTTRDVDAYDLGLILQDDLVDDRYVVPVGANYVTAIRYILTSAGLTTSAIYDNAALLATSLEWEPGTSKGKIVNDLLAGINYDSLYFDGNGIPVAGPYESPATAPSLYDYVTNGTSVIARGIKETLDLSSVPNKFVLVVSTPDLPVIRSVYVNDSPTSPTSTVNVGRTIVSYLANQDAPDQATLDAKAIAEAEKASQVYSQVEFTTGLMPIHTSGDVYTLDWGDGPNRYKETGWSMDLAAGGKMTHKARRVVTV